MVPSSYSILITFAKNITQTQLVYIVLIYIKIGKYILQIKGS